MYSQNDKNLAYLASGYIIWSILHTQSVTTWTTITLYLVNFRDEHATLCSHTYLETNTPVLPWSKHNIKKVQNTYSQIGNKNYPFYGESVI